MKMYHISNFIIFILFVFGLVVLVLDIKNPSALMVFGVIFYFFLFSLILRYLCVSRDYGLFVVLALILHLIGTIYAFEAYIYYDKVLHFTFAIFICFIFNDAFFGNYIPKNGRRHILSYLVIFFFLMGLFSVWEVYEYAEDSLFGYRSQGVFDKFGNEIISPNTDTMQDFISSASGLLFALIFIRLRDLIPSSIPLSRPS